MTALVSRRGSVRAYRPGAAPGAGGRKLSANELPFDPLPSVVAAMGGVAVNRYPDHGATALRARLARRTGVPVDCIAVGAGSVGLIQQLCLAFAGPGDEVAFGWPSFEAYPVMTSIAGATAVTAPLRHDVLDLDALAVGADTRLVFVADPNNPTGTTVDRDAVARLCARVPDSCLVVLDRAYAEFVTAPDAADERELLGRFPNVVVLRTFSKAHGLASLRVGWMVANPDIVAAVDQLLAPFAVNALGQAAALASLDAEDEVLDRVASVVDQRGRLARELRRAGVPVADSQANFVWVPGHAVDVPNATTRVFPEGTRITVGSADDVDHVLTTVAVPRSEEPVRAQAWIDRLDAVEARLAALVHPRRGLTEPDTGGTERWDHRQVWAHVGEFGSYWLDELDRVLAGATRFGRTKTDSHRVASIESGRRVEPATHHAAARRAMARTRRVLAGLDAAGWRAVATHPTLGPMTVDDFLQHFLVGHWEEHAAQLEGLA